MNVLGIDNVLVGVGDLARAKEFYGGVLGLREKFSTEQLALFAIGDERPGLLVRVQDPSPGSMRVWLEVPDARAVAADLGIEPFEVFTGWTVEVPDPWGNIVGLTDYTKQPHLSRQAETGEE